jgi:predicted PhzF superfamily epimerase YddE/YHI9
VRTRILQPSASFLIQQGVEMRRPSEIHVEVVRKDSGALGIRIGGRCAIMGEGAVFLEREPLLRRSRALDLNQ